MGSDRGVNHPDPHLKSEGGAKGTPTPPPRPASTAHPGFGPTQLPTPGVFSPGRRSRSRTRSSSNFLVRGHSPAPWFEPSRARTLTYVCMHAHPWFEPTRSSNVSITWGSSRHISRKSGPRVDSGPRRVAGDADLHQLGLLLSPAPRVAEFQWGGAGRELPADPTGSNGFLRPSAR